MFDTSIRLTHTHHPTQTDSTVSINSKRKPNIRVKFPFLIVYCLELLQLRILLVSERITLCLLLHILAK